MSLDGCSILLPTFSKSRIFAHRSELRCILTKRFLNLEFEAEFDLETDIQ